MRTAMQATSSGAADTDATVHSSGGGGSGSADVDGSDGAGERMERTVAAEQQDRSGNQQPLQPQQQQQQTSLSPSAVLGECHACRGRSQAY